MKYSIVAFSSTMIFTLKLISVTLLSYFVVFFFPHFHEFCCFNLRLGRTTRIMGILHRNSKYKGQSNALLMAEIPNKLKCTTHHPNDTFFIFHSAPFSIHFLFFVFDFPSNFTNVIQHVSDIDQLIIHSFVEQF